MYRMINLQWATDQEKDKMGQRESISEALSVIAGSRVWEMFGILHTGLVQKLMYIVLNER